MTAWRKIASVAMTCLVIATVTARDTEVVDYVNPYMGNISHLLKPTYPTVHLPYAMMRV